MLVRFLRRWSRSYFHRPLMALSSRPAVECLEDRLVPALTALQYAPPTAFTTSDHPYGVVTGDLNRDGKSDIVSVNYRDSTISVLLGNGDGTFQEHRDLAVAADPHGLTIGDFNGDSFLDLATASASRNVSVLLGNGDGTFRPRVDYATGTPAYTVQARDVTGDGRLDLLVFRVQMIIGVLVGNGDGSFQAPVDFAYDAFSCSLGDLNGDGRDDLVSIGIDQTALQVRLADAAGAFQTPDLYYPGGYLDSATINDFNRDGKLDIAIAGGYGGGLSIMLGNGDGSFQPLTHYDAGQRPTAIQAVDLNGDDFLDLLVTNWVVPASATFLLGDGNGGFGPPTSYSMPRETTGFALADFNGDGVPDLAAGSLSVPAVSVLLSQSPRLAIDAGGRASGSFLADMGFANGVTNGTTATIATAGVVNAAPQAIYQTERIGDFSYSCADLTPGVSYTVRLHFAETTWSAADQRRFNVAINGAPALANFDVFAEANGKNIALVKDFGVVADGAGTITITFSSVKDNATVSAIEIIGAASPPPVVPPPTAVTNVRALAGAGQIKLDWGVVAGATTFRVYRRSDAGISTTYDVAGTTFTDKGLVNGTTYYYQVSAINNAGEGPKSAEVNATPRVTTETVWVDDALPTGVVLGTEGGDVWNWVSANPAPFAGSLAHQSTLAAGMHQHFFTNATSKLLVQQGDTLFAYVYLDPANPPTEIMLQWRANGSWDHRAYWGANSLTWGSNGTNTRRSLGILPATGGWVRLEVPAALVGLEGLAVDGMAFTLFGGRATWDRAGKVSAVATPPAAPTLAPATVSSGQASLSWTAVAGATSYNVYRSGGAASVLYRTGLTAAAFTDTGLSNGTTYAYRVTAVNAIGESAQSNEVVATPQALSEFVWVDDALPAGAVLGAEGGDAWTWVSGNPAPAAGSRAHQSNLAAGIHQHFFRGATDKLLVQQGDTLFAYVYLDPTNPPTEIMLQWFTQGNWEHRAYWGADQITAWGKNGTNSRRFMGALPTTGGWVRLEVPAALVGLESATVEGMAFTLFGGRATWDKAGKVSVAASPPAAPIIAPPSAANGQVALSWSAVPGATSYNVYRGTASGGAGSVPYRAGITAASFTDTGLTNSTPYYYQVTAVNSAGESAKSNEVSATPQPATETVWVDDALPTGAVAATEGGDVWNWVSANPAPFAGSLAHQSTLAAGMHQHFFTNATSKLLVQQGDTLFAYVYLDPANPPTEIMLQWRASGSWDHRACWGANSLTWGSNGTNSRRYLGALPATGGWVRLEVPAALVGLEGLAVDGMAFTLFGGRAAWDKAGKMSG